MKIWVDADSCPVRIREIICKASLKRNIPAVFVANREIPLPEYNPEKPGTIERVVVSAGEGAADKYILENGQSGDLFITRDIPLAAELVEKGHKALNDRGVLYTEENVRERLSMRNFMTEMRQSGIQLEFHGKIGKKEIYDFSNAFDRELQKLERLENT
jgi:uncharacterized protein